MPTHYSRSQIALHWAAAILIAFQFIYPDGMEAAWRAFVRTGDSTLSAGAIAHIVVGIVVLAMVVWRFGVRMTRGVPPLPEGEPPLMRAAAHVTHWSLYALMVLLPVSGLVAWYGGVRDAGEVHQVLKTVLLVLIILHIAAALYHHFVLKNGLIHRMRRSR